MSEIGDCLCNEADDILPCRNTRNRPRQDVVEHQGGDRKFGESPAHGLFDDAIDSAARKHPARFDIDGPYGIRKEHHTEDEPRGRTSDRMLGDAAGVESRRTEIVEDDGGSAPEGNEGEHYRCDDDYLRRSFGRLHRTPGTMEKLRAVLWRSALKHHKRRCSSNFLLVTTKTQGNGSSCLTARVITSTKMTEIHRSIFKNILTKNPMKNVKVAIPKLMTAISKNLFQNEMSLATET